MIARTKDEIEEMINADETLKAMRWAIQMMADYQQVIAVNRDTIETDIQVRTIIYQTTDTYYFALCYAERGEWKYRLLGDCTGVFLNNDDGVEIIFWSKAALVRQAFAHREKTEGKQDA